MKSAVAPRRHHPLRPPPKKKIYIYYRFGLLLKQYISGECSKAPRNKLQYLHTCKPENNV